MIANNPISAATHIRNPLDARKACGFSQSKMGWWLGELHPNGHAGLAYTRGAVSQWENGIYPMNDDVHEAYRRGVGGQVSHYTDGMVWATIKFGKKAWRVSVKGQ